MVCTTNSWWSGIISFHKLPIGTLEGVEIERVKSVAPRHNCFTWNENAICSKASKRLYQLKQLRRAGIDSVDLLTLNGSVIRPVLEYACPVWHTSLAVADSAKIESIQRREPELGYDAACSKHHLEKLLFGGRVCLGNFHYHQVRITQITSYTVPTEVNSTLPP